MSAARRRTHTRRLIAALLVGVLATPATAFAGHDLRSPDSRDRGAVAVLAQDLRSPDARDAADPRSAFDATPAVTAAPAVPAAVRDPSTPSFDWASAALGAGVTAGLTLLAAGLLTSRRRAGRLAA